MMLRQLMLGMTDLELHSDVRPARDGIAVRSAAADRELTSLLPLLPEDRFLCSFQHIFSGGYAAGYYSYKWAEILSADAFAAFEEAGLDNDAAVAETGRRFRDTVLALGGGQTSAGSLQRVPRPGTERLCLPARHTAVNNAPLIRIPGIDLALPKWLRCKRRALVKFRRTINS